MKNGRKREFQITNISAWITNRSVTFIRRFYDIKKKFALKERNGKRGYRILHLQSEVYELLIFFSKVFPFK